MITRLLIVIFINLIFHSLSHAGENVKIPPEASGGGITRVSLLSLIVRPELYDGKFVEVDGFVSSSFESSMLFLSKSDLDYSLTANGIGVAVKKEDLRDFRKYDGKCCRVVGTFLNRPHGSTGKTVGVLQLSGISELIKSRTLMRDSILKQLGAVEYLISTKGNEDDLVRQRRDLLNQLDACK